MTENNEIMISIAMIAVGIFAMTIGVLTYNFIILAISLGLFIIGIILFQRGSYQRFCFVVIGILSFSFIASIGKNGVVYQICSWILFLSILTLLYFAILEKIESEKGD